MQRHAQIFLLALMFLGVLTATAQQPTTAYVVESHSTDPSALIFHVSAKVVNGIYMGNAYGGKWYPDSRGPALVSRAGQITGLASMFVQPYQFTFFKKDEASWAKVGPEVLKFLESELGQLKRLDREPWGQQCRPEQPQRAGSLLYRSVCGATVDELTLSFSGLLVAGSGLDTWDVLHGRFTGETRPSVFVGEFSKLEGIERISIVENNLHISKTPACLWDNLLPKIREAVLKAAARLPNLKPAGMKDRNNSELEVRKVVIDGVGDTYYYYYPYPIDPDDGSPKKRR